MSKQYHCRLPVNNVELYVALAVGERFSTTLNDQLNSNGGASLTGCPECLVDDFVHVVGCTVGKRIESEVDNVKIRISEV